jgi:hypothetical protein
MPFATENPSTADEARRNRNRENARRSTGAKTPFGRAASFQNLNRTTHGLTADFHLLPDEPEDLVQQRLDEWSQDLKPETEPERYQVLLVVRASIKLDRADAAEAAAATQQMLAAAEPNDEQIAAAVARLGAVLTTNPPEDPTPLVEQLRKTAQGCKWMLAQWDELIAKLKQVPGRTFEPNERRLGLYLVCGSSERNILTLSAIRTSNVGSGHPSQLSLEVLSHGSSHPREIAPPSPSARHPQAQRSPSSPRPGRRTRALRHPQRRLRQGPVQNDARRLLRPGPHPTHRHRA